MKIEDYAQITALLGSASGVVLRDADTLEGTRRYLDRNPGLSFVAEARSHILGCAMSGHDGRRGYLHHVAVAPQHRTQGIGSALVDKCLIALTEQGITKVHLDVLQINTTAQRFWINRGWKLREDIKRFSTILSGGENA